MARRPRRKLCYVVTDPTWTFKFNTYNHRPDGSLRHASLKSYHLCFSWRTAMRWARRIHAVTGQPVDIEQHVRKGRRWLVRGWTFPSRKPK